MLGLRVAVTAYIDDSQPGWVEGELVDAWGQKWLFHEKVPIVSKEDLDESSPYPQPGFIACVVLNEAFDLAGRDVLTVDTERPWGVEELGGNTVFHILAEQLEELS